jgi:hypothetical protein
MKHLRLASVLVMISSLVCAAVRDGDIGYEAVRNKIERQVRIWTPDAARKRRHPLHLYQVHQVLLSLDTSLEDIKNKLQQIFMTDVMTQAGLFEVGAKKFHGFAIVVAYNMSTMQFKKKLRKPLMDMLKKLFIQTAAQYFLWQMSNKVPRNHPHSSEKKRFKELWIKIEEVAVEKSY